MTTQEKNKAIAEWLGLELNELHIGIISVGRWHKHTVGKTFHIEFDNWQPDKDRNQQKLIEDKLVEMEFHINYEYRKKEKEWFIDIYNSEKDGMSSNKSKDIAFIDAVIELIKNDLQ